VVPPVYIVIANPRIRIKTLGVCTFPREGGHHLGCYEMLEDQGSFSSAAVNFRMSMNSRPRSRLRTA